MKTKGDLLPLWLHRKQRENCCIFDKPLLFILEGLGTLTKSPGGVLDFFYFFIIYFPDAFESENSQNNTLFNFCLIKLLQIKQKLVFKRERRLIYMF